MRVLVCAWLLAVPGRTFEGGPGPAHPPAVAGPLPAARARPAEPPRHVDRAAGGAPSSTTADARWIRHALPIDDVRAVAVDADGAVWIRLATPAGGIDDRVVGIDRAGRAAVYGSLRDVVPARFAAIVRSGGLADFWAAEPTGRVWVGPTYFDGRRWVDITDKRTDPTTPVRFDGRAALDGRGRAWVPFTLTPVCPGPDPCDTRGLQAFTPEAAGERIVFDPAREADTYQVADVHFVDVVSSRGTADARATWAAARLALYGLPDAAPRTYPLLGPPLPGQLRNAGYATAAATLPDGRPQVITWVEVQRPDGVDHRILSNAWTVDRGWDEPEDWTASPLVAADPRGTRIVALAWAPEAPAGPSTVWAAASTPAVAARVAGEWQAVFTAAEIGLSARGRVRDIAVGRDGTVWLATNEGLYGYGTGSPIGPFGRAFLPAARKP